MTAHEELVNMQDRIEALERRNAYLMGVANECARQLQIVGQEGTQIAAEITELRAALLVVMGRVVEGN